VPAALAQLHWSAGTGLLAVGPGRTCWTQRSAGVAALLSSALLLLLPPPLAGEFAMEYSHHSPVTRDVQEQMTSHYAKSRHEK
jgi:hypothetical protein